MDTATLKEVFNQPIVQVAFTILGILIVQILVREIISRLMKHAVRSKKYQNRVDEKKRRETLTGILQTLSAVAIWTVGVFIIFGELNVNLAALATGAGIIGLVVGIGAQSTVNDLLGGLFIIMENQYRVGDVVTLTTGGTEISGVVEDITIRITRLRDLDGNLHTLRNGLTTVVTNRTFDFANVNIDITVAYDADIDTVERVVNEVGAKLAAEEKWMKRIKEPIAFVRVDGFEESGVRIKALGKVQPAAQWEVAGEFRRRIKRAFQTEGIVIPYKQVVVHNAK